MGAMLYCVVNKANDVYSKIVAFNHFSTQALLLIVAISIVTGNFFLIDIALIYASISFISTVALMRFMLF
ncbi:MAG: monovalent cation/H+ antiporter complex subunit F [Wolbachia endosymbiont of Tyrophagus putrescentiae]|nr:monovalent cation/H+ antiporter complex subunit F [Wolbachia endosymbiont of Tyrophagus putrescentiae]